MELHGMKYIERARQKSYRVGRGYSSGSDRIAGKGHGGQRARSGGGVRLGLEDGQISLARRLPKRELTNFNRKEYAIVSVASLNGFEDGARVAPELLIECGLVRKELDGIKTLGEGELEKGLNVRANKFSKSAIATIEQAGEKVEII